MHVKDLHRTFRTYNLDERDNDDYFCDGDGKTTVAQTTPSCARGARAKLSLAALQLSL